MLPLPGWMGMLRRRMVVEWWVVRVVVRLKVGRILVVVMHLLLIHLIWQFQAVRRPLHRCRGVHAQHRPRRSLRKGARCLMTHGRPL